MGLLVQAGISPEWDLHASCAGYGFSINIPLDDHACYMCCQEHGAATCAATRHIDANAHDILPLGASALLAVCCVAGWSLLCRPGWSLLCRLGWSLLCPGWSLLCCLGWSLQCWLLHLAPSGPDRPAHLRNFQANPIELAIHGCHWVCRGQVIEAHDGDGLHR